MKKHFFFLIMVLALLLAVPAYASMGAESVTLNYRDIIIEIDGNTIVPKDANGKEVEPFAMDGTTYLPVRAIAEAIGYDVVWNDAASTVVLTKSFIAAVTSYDEETGVVFALTEDDLTQRIFKVEDSANIILGNVYEFSDADNDMEYDAVKHLADGPNDESESGWQQDAVIAFVNCKEDTAAARNQNTYSEAENYLTFFYAVNGSETRSMDASGAAILDLTGSGITELNDLDDIMFCTVHIVNETGAEYGGYIDYIIVTNTEHADESFHTLSIMFDEGDEYPSAQMKYFYGEDGNGGFGLWAKGKISKPGYSIYTGSLQGDDMSSDLYKMWQKIEYWQYGRNEDGTINTAVRNMVATRESYFGLVNDHPDVQVAYSYAIVQSAILSEDFVMDYSGMKFPAA